MDPNRRLELNRRSLDYYYANLRDDPAYKKKARLKAAAWYVAHREEMIAARRVARLARDTSAKTRKGTKRCGKCKRVKTVKHFPKDSSKRDGLHTTCAPCKKASDARWHSQNREQHNANSKARYRSDPSRYKVTRKAWRENNRSRAAVISNLNVQRRRARLRGVRCD